jgi:hypothetical protein
MGDFVTTASGLDAGWYTAALRRLAVQAPTFAVPDNHDGGIWSSSAGGYRTTAQVSRIVRSAGIQLLANRSQKITQNRSSE